MGAIDVAKLLGEISGEAPCGDDLEYDPTFQEMERASQGKEEHGVGDSTIPAEPPNYRELRRLALEVLSRSHDLRAAIHLSRALAHTDGFPGLSEGLELVRGLHERYWAEMHPQLDPDDDNDPTFRLNTLAALCDAQVMLDTVKTAALVGARGIGQFGLRDVQMASGELPPPPGAAPPDPGIIDAAFMECPVEDLQRNAAAIAAGIEHVKATQAFLMGELGAALAPNLIPLVDVLTQARAVLSDRLSRRGVVQASDEAAGAAVSAPAAGARAAPAASGEIRSREDALRMLDRISDYFVRHEPSSPVPLLLMRAKRLVSRSFMEILRDMAPDGLGQAQNITGVDPDSA